MAKTPKYDNDDDRLLELAEKFRTGDLEAYNQLFEKYHTAIYRYCLKFLGDKELAKDAFQDTFMKMFEHRFEFKSDNFGAWLYTICRNVCLNMIRGQKKNELFDEITHSNYNQNSIDVGLNEQINKALSMLPLQLKEVLVLREYNDLSYQEIADILGIELSLVKIRIHRARNLLRKILIPLQKEIYES